MNLKQVNKWVFKKASSFAAQALDWLAPQLCIYCVLPSDGPLPLCAVCRDEFQENRTACPRCALPNCHSTLCPSCLKTPPLLDKIHAPYIYDPAIAMLVASWKYQKDQRLTRLVADLIHTRVVLGGSYDHVFPVPLHWTRLLKRGFNQAEDLARELEPLFPNRRRRTDVRLKRRRATSSQAGSTRQERRAQLQGAFAVTGSLEGCTVLLIDDVCTTTATASAAARACLDAGAVRVELLCLARTPAH